MWSNGKPFRLSRRAVLRGASGVAIALPWLEAMTAERTSYAATASPRRFVAVYQPGGTILDRWTPSGSEQSFTLGPILAPFEPVKNQIIVLSGIDMKSARGGTAPYASGMVAWLTGKQQRGDWRTAYAQGPSIDQVLAERISNGRPISCLYSAVRWGTGICQGLVSPMDIVSYPTNPPFAPVAPRLDPVATWQALFGAAPDLVGWDQSILDVVDRRYARLAARLGGADRQRLEQHLTAVRELEQRFAASGGLGGRACSPPTFVDTSSSYDPASGLKSSFEDRAAVDPETDAAIPMVGKLMMDMLVMALACDRTAVGTLQWADAEAKYTLPWLGLSGTHHCYMNDCGFQPDECAQIATWYSQQHAYLLRRMMDVDMGGHSLLDETIVFFGSDIQDPASYSRTDMPFVLAGGGSALRTGRWVTYDHVSHNDLLVSLLRLFGGTETTFGDPEFSLAPLPNLT
jgi:hypothetical protein